MSRPKIQLLLGTSFLSLAVVAVYTSVTISSIQQLQHSQSVCIGVSQNLDSLQADILRGALSIDTPDRNVWSRVQIEKFARDSALLAQDVDSDRVLLSLGALEAALTPLVQETSPEHWINAWQATERTKNALGAEHAFFERIMVRKWREAKFGGIGTMLLAALCSFIFYRVSHSHARLQNDFEGLQERTRVDPLTGVATRETALDYLARELARAVREGTPLTTLMIDLDRFKPINDNLSHAAGDLVLQCITREINEVLRAYDMLGRFGGDEFMAVLPACGMVPGAQVAEKIRLRVENARVYYKGLALSVSASVGLSTWSGQSNPSPARLLHCADQALLLAKDQGKNRVIVKEYTEEEETDPGLRQVTQETTT